MKYRFIFVGLFILSCEQKIDRTLSSEGLNGSVKMLMESTHDPEWQEDEVQPSSGISENSFIKKFYFDRKGKILNECRFNSKGNLEAKIVYQYDRSNNATKIASYHSSGVVKDKTTKQYNTYGKLIESHEWDEDEKLLRKQVATVDSIGNRVLTTYQPIKDGFILALVQVLDGNDRVIKNSYFLNGRLKNRDRNKYDQAGNLIETILYDPFMHEQQITLHKYNGRNNKIETLVLKSGLVTSKQFTRYDEQNNVVEVRTYGVFGNLERHEKHLYRYDLHENWTKQVVFVNNCPTAVILHRIEYY